MSGRSIHCYYSRLYIALLIMCLRIAGVMDTMRTVDVEERHQKSYSCGNQLLTILVCLATNHKGFDSLGGIFISDYYTHIM